MKSKITFFALLLFSIAMQSFSQSDIMFEKAYASKYGNYGFSGSQTKDGGYILAGESVTASADCMYLVKTDSLGDTLWTKNFSNSSYYNVNAAMKVRQTKDGGYILVGYSTVSGTNYDDVIYLLKTDKNGDSVWANVSFGIIDAIGYDVQQTYDGGYIIAGTNVPSAGATYACLVKTDSLGKMKWDKYITTGMTSGGYAVKQTFDSGYILTGTTYISSGSGYTTCLVKTDTGGNTQWYKNYTKGSAFYGQNGWDVIQLPDSGYIEASSVNVNNSPASSDAYIIRTNSSGDTLWTQYYSNMNCKSLNPTADGGYAMSGYDVNATEAKLYKLNSSGDSVWGRNYPLYSYCYSYEAHQTKDKGYIMAGATKPGIYNNGLLIKTDSLGNISAPTAINKLKLDNPVIDMFPNPNNGQFTLLSVAGNGKSLVEVYNIPGEMIYTTKVNTTSTQIDISNSSNGIYFYRVITETGELLSEGKFIIQK